MDEQREASVEKMGDQGEEVIEQRFKKPLPPVPHLSQSCVGALLKDGCQKVNLMAAGLFTCRKARLGRGESDEAGRYLGRSAVALAQPGLLLSPPLPFAGPPRLHRRAPSPRLQLSL